MKSNTNVQFTPYEVSFCLYDTERTAFWKQAIEDTVKKGNVVIDAGAGTGILGVFAAMDGAKHIYSLELHPRFCKLIKNLAKNNGVSNKFTIMNGDASKMKIPEKADVIICELLCTGQFFEPQIAVINNLRKFLKPGGQIIPFAIEHYVQLLNAHESLYGVKITNDSRSMMLADDEPVSTKVMYDRIDLMNPCKDHVRTKVRVKARKTKVADAVVITSRAWLTKDLVTEKTKFLYNPEVIFLKEPVKLIKDKTYDVHIEYPYGCDTLNAKIDVQQSP
jgi:predicted RNA methylase